MMIMQMDNMLASSRERAKHLFEKNIELENSRRKSAQARVPSDPNAWQQMRENFEAIILEDNGFSEQYCVESMLWQLHHRRIEELRSHLNAALAIKSVSNAQSADVLARPDRITKIRLQFKTFLTEASGFYHDLMVKMKVKYGLPLDYSSDDVNDQLMDKRRKRSDDVRKGLISCHRCLIYLGDLARYKGLHGESDSRTSDYAAASSYYLQAASFWPSSGNPHHQLAILAMYSGDELVAIYRYFRSLAVDNPFTTARDNLIVAFEKNRLSCSELLSDKACLGKVSHLRKGRGRGEAKALPKGIHSDPNLVVREKSPSVTEVHRSFCTWFVRLNGILFTRTSLEMFDEVLASVRSGFCGLLSSGCSEEEMMNFGADVTENGLFVVRFVSILVFTVHNVKREAEGDTSGGDTVRRGVVLQNAVDAAFILMGHALARCLQLRNPFSSFLLPGILVFVEWLACCPDVAAGMDADRSQAAEATSVFWKNYVSFLNEILSCGWSSFPDDNEDEICFSDSCQYEEGETGNKLALWEDFELRGFLPLLPAHSILDFSRKKLKSGDGSKETQARLGRILAAAKSVMNVVRVDGNVISYAPRLKKFVIGGGAECGSSGECARLEMKPDGEVKYGVLQQADHHEPAETDGEGEDDDDDEVIVFKPQVAQKQNDGLAAVEKDAVPPTNPYVSSWLEKDAALLAQRLSSHGLAENGNASEQPCFPAMMTDHHQLPFPARRNPARHIGPPPGFSRVPARQAIERASRADLMGEDVLPDDYTWLLDDYASPPSSSTRVSVPRVSSSPTWLEKTDAAFLAERLSVLGLAENGNASDRYVSVPHVSSNGGFARSAAVAFPFPGKHVPPKMYRLEKHASFQNLNCPLLDCLNENKDHLHSTSVQFLPQQQQQPAWNSRFIV